MTFKLKANGSEPIYKQLVTQVERALRNGNLPAGEMLPSMNSLAYSLGISRETVKKAYSILTERGAIVPKHGKGFFAADLSDSARPQVLVIFDKFSLYKQIIFNAFSEKLGNEAEITIFNHNQSLDLLEYYLDNNLDNFDYYVVTPHFPLDEESQKRACRQLNRIPRRKLIMLDRLQPGYTGNFGAVYQDFENDIRTGLEEGLSAASPGRLLRVITLPSSLYGGIIRKGVEAFALEHGVRVQYLSDIPDDINEGDTFLLLNSQLGSNLVALAHKIQESGLQIGRDVRIISYNETDMHELVLGGLTTVSTDFREMGRLAAGMILSHKMEKIHCPFHMTRRNTF